MNGNEFEVQKYILVSDKGGAWRLGGERRQCEIKGGGLMIKGKTIVGGGKGREG